MCCVYSCRTSASCCSPSCHMLCHQRLGSIFYIPTIQLWWECESPAFSRVDERSAPVEEVSNGDKAVTRSACCSGFGNNLRFIAGRGKGKSEEHSTHSLQDVEGETTEGWELRNARHAQQQQHSMLGHRWARSSCLIRLEYCNDLN